MRTPRAAFTVSLALSGLASVGIALAQGLTPPVTVVESPWTPAMVTALMGGMALIIAALLAGIPAILSAIHSSRREGAEAGVARDRLIREVKGLVDGPVSHQLRQIADLMEDKAQGSGLRVDRVLAEDARQRSNDKDAVVESAAAASASDAAIVAAAKDKPK